jgi:hypothetical protein
MVMERNHCLHPSLQGQLYGLQIAAVPPAIKALSLF